jgi:gas vesicle protein
MVATYLVVPTSYPLGDKAMRFWTGLGIGLGLGLLYAPKRGQELRSELGEKVTEVSDRAKLSVEDAKDRLKRGMEGFRSANQRATGTEE